MNIAEAKEQIRNAMTAYFAKDAYGAYRIPIEKQRPVFLIGPPGIGKTAIMEQVAAELGVGLVSYSMTHHTRQSALGLPYIVEKEYGGKPCQVSEYTMSEIIASVYELMAQTGVREGILFLDEINCVSETLAPCMLQFLQYKVFGQHQVPPGWIVVTAGNPPEYNKSVRDFDVVTWDRLKRIDVEPDYAVWKQYAGKKGVHASVLTYLSARQKDFYVVESTVDGKHFVTARGWDDLSEMIQLYEENGLPVNEKLIGQYLQSPRIARDFAIYYDLFVKYRSDYQIEAILAGKAPQTILVRAQQAQMDERLLVLGLLFDAVTARLRAVCVQEDFLSALHRQLQTLHAGQQEGHGALALLEQQILQLEEKLSAGARASSVSAAEQKQLRALIAALQSSRAQLLLAAPPDEEQAFALLRQQFEAEVAQLKEQAQQAGEALRNVFAFCEQAFVQGEELLIFVTELTSNYYSARFIGRYGCEAYYIHSKQLQFQERRQEIQRQLDTIAWTL